MFFSSSISLFIVSFLLLLPSIAIKVPDTEDTTNVTSYHDAYNLKYGTEIRVAPIKVIQQFAILGDGKTHAIFKSDTKSDTPQQKWTYTLVEN